MKQIRTAIGPLKGGLAWRLPSASSRNRRGFPGVIATTLLAAAACEPLPEVGTIKQSISLGTEVASGEFAATVGLRFSGTTSGVTCTGTLVAPRWVITAAHCVLNVGTTDPAKWTVLANQVDLNRLQAFTSAVVEVRVHPDWNPNDITLGRGDVALMKLADDVPGVQPAPPSQR